MFLRSKMGDMAKAKPLRADQEFLPAALEILETPASPNHVTFMLTICALAIIALTWSYLGRIDIVAVSQGKIQPAGRVKVIQPVEGGRVTAIHVENGAYVRAGGPLIDLDASEVIADEAASQAALNAFKAEALRRRTALMLAEEGLFERIPRITWQNDIPALYRSREERVLKGDWAQLAAAMHSFSAQLDQKKAEQIKHEKTILEQEALIATLKGRVALLDRLVQRKLDNITNLINAKESLQTQQANVAMQMGELAEAKASREVIVRDRDKALESFIADNGEKLAQAERQADDLEQKLAKTRIRLDHTRVISPLDGVVFASSVTTLGQVLSAGEEVMRVVPAGAEMEIEAYVENKDIGFVALGQPAIVKVESFPFTRYGIVDAQVTGISHDAIPEPDVQAREANPAKSTRARIFSGAERVQNLMFPVTLRLKARSIRADGIDLPLSPGMAVTVEVKTGKRRILEYVFSPLVETVSQAMRER